MKKLKASLADVTKKGGSIWVNDDGYISMHEPGWYSIELHPLSAYRVAKTYFKNYQEFLSEIEYDKTPPALRVSGEDATDAWFILFGGRGGYNDLMDLLASDLEEEKNYGYLTDEKEHAMWDKYDQDGLTQYLWDNLIGSSDEGAILQFIEDAVNDVSWEDLLTEAEAYMYTLVGDDIKGAEKVEAGIQQDILNGYLDAMLWSSHDDNQERGEFLDANFAIIDIAPESIKEAQEDIQKFLSQAGDLLNGLGYKGYEAVESPIVGYDWEMLGHDLWLTRNGHGAGFWDRNELKKDGLGDKLSDIARKMGEKDPYVGDDGKVYIYES
jgi:hypothetical protein